MNGTLIKWITGDDTGISSKAIFAIMQGVEPDRKWGSNYPSDPADFGRCYRLLKLIPEWKLDVSKFDCPVWKEYIRVWGQFEKLWEEESPGGRCPKLYKLMQDIQDDFAPSRIAYRKTIHDSEVSK